MIGCDNTVTIIHKDIMSDDDALICTTFNKASWFKKLTISTSGDGVKPVNTYECRIMGRNALTVNLGDYVALGVVKDIETVSQLKSVDYFRVTAIGDNRRGNVPHWRLSGQ